MTIREYLAQFDWEHLSALGMKVFLEDIQKEFPDLDENVRLIEIVRWMNAVRTDGGYCEVEMSYEKDK